LHWCRLQRTGLASLCFHWWRSQLPGWAAGLWSGLRIALYPTKTSKNENVYVCIILLRFCIVSIRESPISSQLILVHPPAQNHESPITPQLILLHPPTQNRESPISSQLILVRPPAQNREIPILSQPLSMHLPAQNRETQISSQPLLMHLPAQNRETQISSQPLLITLPPRSNIWGRRWCNFEK
jgi:hypothetical protein